MTTAPLLITRWATQDGRAPEAFSPERAKLDGRGLAEMLAHIAHLAGEIPFHDEEGREAGDWCRVLGADASFVLALLATADVDARAEELEDLLHRARASATPHEAEEQLGAVIDALLGFADALDRWLAPAEFGDALGGQSVHALAETAIEHVLAPQLQALFDEVAAAEEAGLTNRFRHHRHRWESLRRPWRRAVIEGEIRGIAEAVERAWADRLLDQVADAVETFLREVRVISERAQAAFAASLASGTHSPHAALVIAFAQLLGHAQAQLNRVPQELIDFYQREVLRSRPGPARADRVLLTVSPKPSARPSIAKGELIPGGGGITFAADAALDVTGATLREARLWRPEGGGATVATLMAGPGGALDGLAKAVAVPVESSAIFSSPLLDLPGGTRRIELSLTCVWIPGPISIAGMTAAVSTAAGWTEIPTLSWTLRADFLGFTAILPPDFPPLAPCARLAEAGIRITTPDGALAGVRIVDASLSIAVKDAPGLEVRTPAGPASAEAAAPFGVPPYPGGWLRIDHPALAGPPLDRLVLRFDWASLPPGDAGFDGYYRGYAVDQQGQLFDWSPFDNAEFAVTLAAPVLGWDASQRLPLFAPASLGVSPPQAAVAAPDVFSRDFEAAPPLMPAEGPLAPSSWLAAAAGRADTGGLPDHLTVTLAAPAEGFGHALYPANVQYATEAIARGEAPPPKKPGVLKRIWRAIVQFPNKLFGKLEGHSDPEPEPASAPVAVILPNPPFQPMLSGIKLDYGSTVDAGELRLHHAGLLGSLEAIVIEGGALFPTLLTRLVLDLAFEGARPGDVLALLVRSGASVESAPPSYAYRTASGWDPLPNAAVIGDETHGLAATGILRIALPGDAAVEDGALWLRVLFDHGVKAPPPLVAITPDALSATRLLRGDETALVPLPAGTITTLPGVRGVARVAQPLDGAGGQGAEQAAALRARTAERVRHRERALTAWDIERLVLSEFADIASVRVFTEGDPARDRPSGRVTVVAMLGPGGAVPPDAVRPCAPSQLRESIAARLAVLASPFARIDVVDPDYVPVDVTARLVMTGGSADAVTAALTTFLSPWAEPGLELSDTASVANVRAAIAAFLLAQPGVQRIDRLGVTLGDYPADAHWLVPTIGEITVSGIAAATVGTAW